MENTDHGSRVFTIPNLLSAFRILLIPFLVWSYCGKRDAMQTGVILLVSGLTDLADGFIARRFHMTSDLGKVLDPLADKLTQGAMLLCLVTRFRLMWLPLGILLMKEAVMAVTGALVIQKTGEVHGADWHGKVATTLLYLMMGLHVLWFRIPETVSNVTILLCACMMLVSFILYTVKNCRLLRQAHCGSDSCLGAEGETI